jgi:hypothetical protein
MKNSIRFFWGLALCFTLFTMSSCEKEQEKEDAMQEATITSFDVSLCACCGGWFVTIEGQRFRFYELPESKISLDLTKQKLPLTLRISWKPKEKPCMPDLIDVLAYEL